MKKVFFLLTGITGFTVAMCQQKSGTITYERKMNMHRQFTDPQMQAMMPEYRTSQYVLLFSDSLSVYRSIPEDEAPDPFAGGGNGGPRMMFRGGADGGDLFNNFAQAKTIQSVELGGKNFLIIDTIKQQPWKLSDETKQILGFTCHKATRKITQQAGGRRMMMMSAGGGAPKIDSSQKSQSKEVELVAWYADNIITPAGPDSYGQLPGAILQIDVDNGLTVITAKEIKTTVDQKELKEPKKGKTVTRAEYIKMMTQMMEGGMGGGGTVRFGG